jgi:hypothetical protein
MDFRTELLEEDSSAYVALFFLHLHFPFAVPILATRALVQQSTSAAVETVCYPLPP